MRDYESLPDSMAPADLAVLFNELLESPPSDPVVVVNALYQLADRQWHTYDPLSPTLQQRVDAWMMDNWLSSSLPFTVAATSVIGHLGLPRSWANIQTLANNTSDPDIASELRAFCAEMECGDPLDPWSGMPKP
jgi:hypothetical protein